MVRLYKIFVEKIFYFRFFSPLWRFILYKELIICDIFTLFTFCIMSMTTRQAKASIVVCWVVFHQFMMHRMKQK